MLICLIVIALVVAADQLSKQLVVHFLDRIQPFDVIPGVFRFTYVENRGAAFGMLDDHRWVFMIISTVAIVAMLIYMWKFAAQNAFLRVGLSLVIGGGIGNMIDRIAYGYVVDFLDFCAFPTLWKWVFNVADACVCVGAGMVMLYLVLEIIKEAKAENAAKAAGNDELEDNNK